MRGRPDVTSIVTGVAVSLLGTLLLLQAEGTIDLEAGWLLSALAAMTGVVLVVSGIGARRN